MTRSQTDLSGGFIGMNPIPVLKAKHKPSNAKAASITVVERAAREGWIDEVPSMLAMLGIERS